ncbi:MAG: cytochrome c biogenesis protein ResB, partial [Dehalococcoidia bacterium]
MTLADTLRGTLRSGGGFDPFRAVWRFFTSVRVAIYLLALVALAALLGTVFPQIPGPMRGSPAATSAWLELQKGKYGPLTPTLHRLGLFEVFHTFWFNGLLVLVVLAVAICTTNRFRPTWRSITCLQTRVAAGYFKSARHRARRDAPVDPDALVAALRRRRYLVRRTEEADGAVSLYADRYRWAQLATFASHLSLILLLAGGLVTKLLSYEMPLYIAEGRTAPVFPVVNERQMQIEVKQFVEGRDEQGNITGFHSTVVLYSRGEPVKEGEITVNGPMKWGGFVFHQVARQVNGAELEVRDRASGQLVYKEILDLSQGAPRPRLTIQDAQGQV